MLASLSYLAGVTHLPIFCLTSRAAAKAPPVTIWLEVDDIVDDEKSCLPQCVSDEAEFDKLTSAANPLVDTATGTRVLKFASLRDGGVYGQTNVANFGSYIKRQSDALEAQSADFWETLLQSPAMKSKLGDFRCERNVVIQDARKKHLAEIDFLATNSNVVIVHDSKTTILNEVGGPILPHACSCLVVRADAAVQDKLKKDLEKIDLKISVARAYGRIPSGMRVFRALSASVVPLSVRQAAANMGDVLVLFPDGRHLALAAGTTPFHQ